jgi:hypothetical protein
MSVFFRTLLVCLCLVAAVARGDDRLQSQITAAASNAVEKLAADVFDEQIGVDLTVADFVHDTSSLDRLMDLLRQSQQIGGPRWLDDQTCQVKLAIEGPRVLELLRQTAELNGNTTPIPAQALVKRLKDWKDRTFVATGTAISLKAAQELPPPTMTAWDQIPADARRQAVLAAANNAAVKAMDNLKSVEYQPGQPLSKVLSNEVVQQKLNAYLSDRPVTAVHFANDGSVETTLSLSQDDLVEAVVDALQAGSIEFSREGEQLARLRNQIDGRLNTITGKAKAGNAAQSRAAAITLPGTAPEWTREIITVIGNSKPSGSRLMTARKAEDLALAALRGKIESLSINGTLSLGDWSRQNISVRRVLDDTMLRARVTKIDYAPDGSATVKLSLDPRDLWDGLRELP